MALLAYIERNAAHSRAMTGMRARLRDKTRAATCLGFGPRFLHSTGQFHKGGPAVGVFLQITATPSEDLEIPGRPFTFGQLIQAQAAGDASVLGEHGRPVLTLTLTNPEADVVSLFEAVN